MIDIYDDESLDFDDIEIDDELDEEVYQDTKNYCIDKEYEKVRIDKFLSDLNKELTRSHIQKIINQGLVCVNGKTVKASYKLSLNDNVVINIPMPKKMDIKPYDYPLDIIYEDDDILIVNKEKGMVVHPAPGHLNDTLVNAIMFHCKENLSGINGELRPGIVHRIDRDTTGVLVICKNDLAHEDIAKQLKDHSITRKYYAIVVGNIKEDDGVIDAPIGRNPNDRKKMAIVKNGRRAVTHFKVLERFGNYTYVECELETGRTHQIRVHMKSIGHPLLGDDVYGAHKSQFKLDGQTLHAGVLGFIHPRTGEYVEFKADLPEYFEKILKVLRNKTNN